MDLGYFGKNTYLVLDVLAIIFPLVLSFDKKVGFYKNWKYLFPAILVIGFMFILWDIKFTEIEAWGFNPNYITGIYLYNLPIEEVLFFVIVPYASVFIYACVDVYLYKIIIKNDSFLNIISRLLGLGYLTLGLTFIMHIYSFLAFTLAGIILLYASEYFKKMPIYLVSFLISLIPFVLMNGILTYLPVVWYSDNAFSEIRFLSIPIEDSAYLTTLLLPIVIIFEALKNKSFKILIGK